MHLMLGTGNLKFFKKKLLKSKILHSEYGLGMLSNSLQLGCDCLGEIRYFNGYGLNRFVYIFKFR